MCLFLPLWLLSCLFLACASAIDNSTIASTFRAASWNVYYKALDDSFGSAAIASSIDKANDLAPFDFVGVVEAGGDVLAGIINPKNQQIRQVRQAARAQSAEDAEMCTMIFELCDHDRCEKAPLKSHF